MRAIAALITSTALLLAPAASAEEAGSEVERLEALGRLWVYADYFNPYLGVGGVDWDQALIEATPAVRRARTRRDFVAALDALLARSGDPAARIVMEAPHAEVTPPSAPSSAPSSPVRVEDGVAIGDCRAMMQAMDSGDTLTRMRGELQSAERGAVIDCRGPFGSNRWLLAPMLQAIARNRTNVPLAAGAALMRSYSGFPPHVGTTSGGYSAGVSLVENPPIPAAAAAPPRAPLVFLADHGVADAIGPIAALQAAGLARIVVAGDVADIVSLDIGAARMHMSRSVYVDPNGAIGLQADALAPVDDEAAGLRIAIEQLTGTSTRQSDFARHVRPRRAPHVLPVDGVPPVEARLLALFRLWGTIEYFFPYKTLMDRPWSETLAEFIPVFIAADTRERYEVAVSRLVARTQDTHASFVAGMTAILPASTPAIQARYIEGRPVIIKIQDPALADQLAVGDEILSVDGAPVARIENRLTPLLAASTPQALRNSLAWRMLGGPENSEAMLRVRGADGRVRSVRAVRNSLPSPPQTDEPVWRMLDDGVGYINLERLAPADADRALDELMQAQSLILDLRGYPQGTAWVLAPRLASREEPIVGAQFRRPLYMGPPQGEEIAMSAAFEQMLPQRDAAKYTGSVFVLIDERAISQAEHTALFLEAATDVTFVGEPTNGANGDITNVALPGGLIVRFTGHDVRHADGRQLQRVGIQPDVPVISTLAGLRAGRDEVLEAALALARR